MAEQCEPPEDRQINRRSFIKLAAGALALSAAAALPKAPAVEARRAAPALLRRRLGTQKPNLIWIVSDALRGDHISANGYARETTPNIDQWIAKDGISFVQATSPAAWTYPATAAMLTGRQPFKLNANWINQQLPATVPTIAEQLRAAGYGTAGFVSAPYSRGQYGLGRGFDVYNDSLGNWPVHLNGQAAQINSLAQTWLNGWAGDKPLFLFLYYFDTHTWYKPPAPYDTLYDPTYEGAVGPEIYQNGERVVMGSLKLTPRDTEHVIALYDGELAYFDARLGELFGYLKGKGILDNAVIGMTADHGDMFGEHGLWTHGNCLYEETLRIPLLLRHTALPQPGRMLEAPAQNMDIGPTFLDWAGAAAAGRMDGVSLKPQMEGLASAPRDAYSEIEGVTNPLHWAYWLAPRDSLRSVRRGDYKYIHHVGNDAADELYVVAMKSVHERENVIASQPGKAAELRAAIEARYRPERLAMPAVMR